MAAAVPRPRLPFGLRLQVFVRSLSLQASWNGQRMQNLGLLTILLPWLRRQDREITRDRLFCRRYYEFFNTNPYLANYLVGGLLRLEHERAAGARIPPGMSAMVRDSLGRAFASIGDQLFWLGLRPVVTVGCCLAAWNGHPGWVLLLVGAFAVWQLGLRWRALQTGFVMGQDIVDLLDRPRWHRAITGAKRLGMVLSGALAGSLVLGTADPEPTAAGGLLLPGVLAGLVLPLLWRRRIPGEGLLPAALALAGALVIANGLLGG